jgi:phosphonate transport system substrate-binding protein
VKQEAVDPELDHHPKECMEGAELKIFASAILVLSVFLSPCSGFARDFFVLGVAPHTSARVILEMYQPLRVHLEKSLNMVVEVATAPDFGEFARRALAGEYDLAVTTGHQARLLQTDAGYIPMLTYKADFKAVAIVAKDGPIQLPKDLEGKNALGLSPSSLVTLWGQHWLADNNLGSVRLRYVSASDSVAQAVVAGDAAVGFTSLANFQTLSPELQSPLRILAESPMMAGRVYMLNNRYSVRQKEIDSALRGFAETVEGKDYFGKNKLGGYRDLEPKELEAMDSYAAEVKASLYEGGK